MTVLARSIFDSAGAYERAARLLNASSSHDLSLRLPGHVNAALSLELYFKSLYLLEHGTEFKVNGKHSHRFGQLFQELTEPTRKDLTERFKLAVSQMDPLEIPRLESLIGGFVPKDLKTNLVEWATIFTDLRYAHSFIEKYEGKKVAMAFYPQIVAAVRGVILEREPSWASESANTAMPNPALQRTAFGGR
jgi:hypothetical protein